MALPTSGNEINFGALADNRSSASKANISLRQESILFASGSVGPTGTSRASLNAEPHAISELGGADYANTVFSEVVAKLSTTTVGAYVDGETGARIYWDVDDGTTDDYTAGLKLVSDNSIVISATLDFDGYGAPKYVTLGTIPNIAEGTDKYYPFVSTGTYTNAVSSSMDHFDQLAGTTINAVSVQTLDASSETNAITFGISTSAGTGTSWAWTFSNASNGDNSARSLGSSTSATPSVTYTGTGLFPVNLIQYGNPTTDRNYNSATAINVDVRYNNAIDSLTIDDTTINVSAVDGANNATFTCFSEGYSGTLTIGYDTNNTTTDTTYTNTTEPVSTLYIRESISKNFTISSAGTYYPKAHHGGTAVVGSSFIVAPAFSYTPTANATINVNQTQALAVSSVVGNSAAVVITSSPSAGNGTNSATLSPGTNNRVYTITYDGAANYSQTQDYSRTVTVNPTVSLSLSDNQSGNNYPINDAHGSTITSGTHGVSPTLFTVAPTVVGDTVTYAWTTSGFTFTSGGGSTAGTVIFKKNSSGTTTQTLTVSGNSTSANDAVSIVAQSVTKAITAGTKPATLRAGTTFSVTSISANYTQTVHLLRDGVTIGAAASIGSTMNFSIASTNAYTNYYDGNNVNTYLRDNDNTSLTFNLGTTVMLPPLPVIDDFTVVQDTAGYLRKIDVAWATTHATDVTIDLIGSGLAADGSSEKAGLSHGTAYTFNITAYNAPDESVSTSAAATTINPSVSISTEGTTSFTYGDTGTYTVAFTKNFKDGVYVHSGYGLNASETGGTETQILGLHGIGATSFSATFNKNWFGGSSFASIIDYRVGSADAGWFPFDQNRSFADFSTTGAPTSVASGTVTGTAIQITWANSAGAQTGVQINYGVASPSDFLSTVNITNGSTAQDITDLDNGTTYQFRMRTYTTKTTTPLGSSESRTNYSTYSSTINVSTIGWSSIVLDGNTMGVASGTGYSTQEAAHLSNDEQNTAYYVDTTTLGTHTVDLKRGIDSSQVWDGNGYWYGVGSIGDRSAVAYVRNNTGDIISSQYILVANTQPNAPTSITFSSVTTTSITIGWNDNSSIETGYKIYHRTGGAATNAHTLINTTSANATSYNATSLATGTEHYFAVYAYRGSGLSDVLQGNEGTLVPDTITSISASPTSWEYGSAGNVTIYYSKNFTDAISIAMFNGGTTYQTQTSVGSGITGATAQTFTKNWVTAVGASNWLDFKFSYASSGILIHTEYNLAKAVEVTTPTPAPEVVATNGSSTSYCEVSWTTPSNVNDGYAVYRSGTSGGSYSLLAYDSASPYQDTTGTAGTTYYYKVKAKRTMTAYTGGSSAVARSVYGALSDYDAGWKGTSGGGGCWSLDSMVTMADNTLVRLGDVQVGDEVKSFAYQDMIDESEGPRYTSYTNNTLTDGYFTTSTIISKTLKTLSSYYIINDNIKVSSQHPLWVFSNDTWKWDYTPNITIGCKLVNTNKEEVNVDSIILVNESLEAGYINVEDVDTCFIQNVLVHNAKE